MAKIRAVFTDIDNTLTSPITHEIPQSAVRALELARKNGIQVVAATGRNLIGSLKQVLEKLEFDAYITVNGQYCYLPDGTTLRFAPFDPVVVERTIELSLEHGFFASYFEKDRIYVNGIDPLMEDFFSILKSPVPPILPSEKIDKEGILSIIPFVPHTSDEHLRSALPECQLLRWNPYACDLVPKSGGKEVGLSNVLEHFGLSQDECLAIGDGGNDVGMISTAGVGVAVGGAVRAAKDAADFIAPRVDDNAIEVTFKHFGLI